MNRVVRGLWVLVWVLGWTCSVLLSVAQAQSGSTAVAPAPGLEPVPEEIVLGFNPAENAQGLQSTANELARFVSERLQLPVRAYVSLDYTALVEAMRSGQVQVGWLTPSPLVLAEEMFGVEVLLTQVRKGSPSYFSAIVVREDSALHALGDLRGRTIAWVDPQSTSGYVIPRYLLQAQGFDPQTLFRQQMFAGGHDSAVIAVRNGQVDAAAVWADPPDEHTGAWTRYLRNSPGPKLRAIFYSPAVPSDAVGVHPEFARTHPKLLRKLSEVLMSMGQNSNGRDILRRLNSTDGFVSADRSQYELVRRAFQSNRHTAPRTRGFEHPGLVWSFLALCVLAASLALPFWKRFPRGRLGLAWTLFALAFGGSLWGADFSWLKLWHGRGAMWARVREMAPPEASVVPAVFEQAIVTLQLALVGTVLAVPVALLAAFLAAENVTHSRWLRGSVRLALNFNRSVDTLILALVLVSAVGLGPLPGVVALAVHSVGAMGKLFYEALETLDPGPVEAMRSVGARRLQVLRWGLWPQFASHFISIVLFRFELNVRVSTVLGLVGAGGIGFLLLSYTRGAEYRKASVVITAIVLLVLALDSLSNRLRKNVR